MNMVSQQYLGGYGFLLAHCTAPILGIPLRLKIVTSAVHDLLASAITS